MDDSLMNEATWKLIKLRAIRVLSGDPSRVSCMLAFDFERSRDEKEMSNRK